MSASTSWGERICLLWKCVTGAEEMLGRKGLAVWTEGWRSKPGTSGMLKTCPRKSGFNGGGARGVAQDFIVVGKNHQGHFWVKMPTLMSVCWDTSCSAYSRFCGKHLTLDLWEMTWHLMAWCYHEDVQTLKEPMVLPRTAALVSPTVPASGKLPLTPLPFPFLLFPVIWNGLVFPSSALWRFGENGVKTALCAVLWRKCCFTPRPLRRLHLFSVWLLDVSVGR